MLARVLKSAQSSAPSSPAKSKEQYTTSSMAHSTASHGGVPPSPSKIPRATKESATSKENAAPGAAGAGANGDRSSYLSFLWNQNNQNHNNNQDKGAGAHVSHGTPAAPQGYDEDVHMMTVKGTIAPGALKGAVAVPPVPPMPPMPAGAHNYHYQKSNQPHLAAPGAAAARYDEDVRMRTAKPEAETQVPQRGLSLWEREHLDSPEVRRKATVAQIYFLDYYFDLLGYHAGRKRRLDNFKKDTADRNVTADAYTKELQSYNGRERVLLRKRRTKLKVDQFRIIAQVGQGGYGSVYLARKVETNEVCALKKMRKGTLAKMDEVKHVLVERDILTAVKTPWLVRLLYAFQDKDHVYLAMEYVPGGDFRTLLNNSGVLKEEHARFYAAEMFAGVNELHKLGYIHRDLKPENFLVDGTGHVKLTDFGLATGSLNPQKIDQMKSKLDQVSDDNLVFRSTLERRTIYRSIRMAEPRYADSVVGSPDYMPPEVLRGKTYTFSADYWSLGCILFEFLCGFPPFSGSTPEETWANLKNWTRVLRRPVYDRPEDLIFNLSDVAWDAVTRLIAHPKDRISTLQDVQKLPFFSPLPFPQLRQLAAPFVPVLDGETDVGYFDSFSSPEDMAKYAEVFKKQRDVEAVVEKGNGNRNNWVGFTFGRNAGPTPSFGLKPEGEPLAVIF